MPGSSLRMGNLSFVKPPASSEVEPLRSTRTLRGLPLVTKAFFMPASNIIKNTAVMTVNPMPKPVISVSPLRRIMFRMLYLMGIAILLVLHLNRYAASLRQSQSEMRCRQESQNSKSQQRLRLLMQPEPQISTHADLKEKGYQLVAHVTSQIGLVLSAACLLSHQ